MSRKLQADLLLTLCSLVWGVTFVVVKDALTAASVLVFLALRFGLAAVFLAIVYRGELRRASFPTAAVPPAMLMGCFLFAGFVLQTAGIKLTTPSKAAFITGFSVILVPVLLAVFGALRIGGPQAGPARINGWVWTGALAALVGLYYLTVPSMGSALRPVLVSAPGGPVNTLHGGLGLGRGDLLVLCGALMFALHIVTVGHYIPRHAAAALTLGQVATMALLALVAVPLFALAGWQAPRVEWTTGFIAAVLVTGILATALAFSAQIWAQQHTSSAHTAILFSLEPVFAALTSFLFLHERLGGRALAGGALILAGILLAELRGPQPAAPESLADAANVP